MTLNLRRFANPQHDRDKNETSSQLQNQFIAIRGIGFQFSDGMHATQSKVTKWYE